MAMDPFGWSKWSSHLGNAITIATGIPALSSVVAGLWAYLVGAGISIFLVVLAAFTMTLWCCIGILWLKDRAQSIGRRPALDCSWGLRVDAAFLNRDVTSNFEWQVVIQFRNVLDWPIRVDTIKTFVEIENVTPSTQMEYKIPVVLTKGSTTGQNLPPYIKGALPDKERYKGKIDLFIRYGHPDYGYSRLMTRKFIFEIIVKPQAPPGMQGVLMPMSGSIPLGIGSYEEELDEPYHESKPT
ncbi:hypothetical protein [Rhodopila sp.]|uniref:hypothetical protein n=1 Tax=Rhodopila sp. TaxID=2480087 RepID=UPI003D0F3912